MSEHTKFNSHKSKSRIWGLQVLPELTDQQINRPFTTWNESVKAGKLQDWDREPQVSYDVVLYPDYNHPWWLPVARGRKRRSVVEAAMSAVVVLRDLNRCMCLGLAGHNGVWQLGPSLSSWAQPLAAVAKTSRWQNGLLCLSLRYFHHNAKTKRTRGLQSTVRSGYSRKCLDSDCSRGFYDLLTVW